jgi:hypothetical protein
MVLFSFLILAHVIAMAWALTPTRSTQVGTRATVTLPNASAPRPTKVVREELEIEVVA